MKVKKYFRPRDLNEFHRLSAENPDHKILAGGTYVAKMKFPK
ncbi:FAD binding domain-containing protein, partial [Candidatus Calescamantes bacterium]|nr:FAD binding domain-containing protein [Candidatus Calescamantes bacterium]